MLQLTCEFFSYGENQFIVQFKGMFVLNLNKCAHGISEIPWEEDRREVTATFDLKCPIRSSLSPSGEIPCRRSWDIESCHYGLISYRWICSLFRPLLNPLNTKPFFSLWLCFSLQYLSPVPQRKQNSHGFYLQPLIAALQSSWHVTAGVSNGFLVGLKSASCYDFDRFWVFKTDYLGQNVKWHIKC